MLVAAGDGGQARNHRPEPAMNSNSSFSIRHWMTRFAPWAACLAMLAMARLAAAQDVVHIEEDWELVLGGPDQNVCAPQVATTMSPYNHINDTFFTLEVNHRSAPYWTPGGLTIHHWNGEWRMQSFDRADRSVMNTESETVTWTQILDVNSGQLTFQIKYGTSTTWGPFGYSNMFKLHTNWGGNLNNYSPDVSVSQSGVAFAGNRVKSLKIKEIRLTLDDGTELADPTERVVHLLVE
jgi:hypothetical protein